MLRRRKAASTLEYTLLFVTVCLAIMYMQKYFYQANLGRWKTSGESWSFGRQYDPNKTIECAFFSASGQWYDVGCADAASCWPVNSACLTSAGCLTAGCQWSPSP